MLSGDQNIVEINFSVLWRVSDPKKYLFNVSEPRAFLRRVAESAMRELVGRSTAEQVRTERRAEVEEGVRALAAERRSTRYNAGIIDRRRAARARRSADRGGGRLRRGAARAAGSRPLPARGRPIRQPAARRRARRGGAGDRDRRTATSSRSWRRRRASRSASSRCSTEYERAEDVTRKRLYPGDDRARLPELQQDHPGRAGRAGRAALSAARPAAAEPAARAAAHAVAGDGTPTGPSVHDDAREQRQ